MPNASKLNEAIVTLVGILQRQRDTGEEGVPLAEKHLALLRELPQKIRQHHRPPAPVEPARPNPVATTSGPQEVPATVAAPPAGIEGGSANRGAEPLHPAGGSKPERLNKLARMVKADKHCRALGTLRETMVFATGNPDARLMLVGEAPGAEEEREKKPFVGPAGQLLDKILAAMDLSREDVYISNIVKFRPQVTKAGSPGAGNRKPHSEEIASCLKYIMAEIDVVQPAVIIALGGTAASALLGDNSPVGSLRQRSHSLKGIPLVVTYHPSYLLHCESNSPAKLKAEKAKVWRDMKLALEKLKDAPSQSRRHA